MSYSKTNKLTEEELNGNFINAVKNNDLDKVNKFLKEGADIHVNDDEVLIFSAEFGHHQVVKLLLEKCAYNHEIVYQALHWGACNGHREVVKVLIENTENLDIETVESILNYNMDLYYGDGFTINFKKEKSTIRTRCEYSCIQ